MSNNARRIKKGYHNKWQVDVGQEVEANNNRKVTSIRTADGKSLTMKTVAQVDEASSVEAEE